MPTQIHISQNGITTLATAGKYCDRNIAVNVAVPTGQEIHKITVETALNTQTATWLLTANAFVKAHYADPGFMVQLISLQTINQGYGIYYACNSNRQMTVRDGSGICGFNMNLTSANSTDV